MESYSDTLLRNIGKAFYLPRKQSPEYRSLWNEIHNIFEGAHNNTLSRQDIFNRLNGAITPLKRLPPRTTRSNERISTIVEMLQSQSFTPKNVLDIGAGNGQITSALRAHYNLPYDNVFAIDEKLPPVVDVKPITYINGSIPLADNSIDVIIMFAVLHHIPPDVRINIMKEAARVLAPGGYVIIREHNDNHDPDFYVFLDLLHLFWYVTENETIDPLYLMSRDETTKLFHQVNLVPVQYSTYPEPNPQRLYHEMFTKPILKELPLILIPATTYGQRYNPVVSTVKSSISAVIPPPQNPVYRFIDKEAQARLQIYVDILRAAPKTIASLDRVVPSTLHASLVSKYSSNLVNNPDQTWGIIVKEVALKIILESVKFVPKTNDIYYITTEAIDTAAQQLGWQ